MNDYWNSVRTNILKRFNIYHRKVYKSIFFSAFFLPVSPICICLFYNDLPYWLSYGAKLFKQSKFDPHSKPWTYRLWIAYFEIIYHISAKDLQRICFSLFFFPSPPKCFFFSLLWEALLADLLIESLTDPYLILMVR